MKILLSGGTGFLGSKLIELILKAGHDAVLLTRQSADSLKPNPCTIVNYPISTKEEKNRVLDCDVVINLAGESIFGPRWSDERKQKLISSRVNLTKDLVDLFRESTKLKAFISSSAIGFYGNRKSEVLSEESPIGEGFLAEVCKLWETEALKASRPGVHVTLLRTGIVLGRQQGALAELENLYQNKVGGPVGSGDQFMSWIHVEDWASAVMHCLNEKIEGPVNLVAPEPVTNRSFSQIMAEMFRQKIQIPAPACALKIAMGEQASIVLEGQNVRPKKLLESRFKFQFPYLREALWDLFQYEKEGRIVYDFFQSSQWIPASIDNVFSFFSDEKNLEKMSPPQLKFRVLKKSTEKIGSGTLIDYKLKIRGIPANWQTLITSWNPPSSFSDFQKQGPYSYWHHTHSFQSLAGGTLMTDQVHYRLPLGWPGRLLSHWFVKGDLKKIFSFRRTKIHEVFGMDLRKTK